MDEQLQREILEKEIKALFLDEWDIDGKLIKRLPNHVDIIWIAPNQFYMLLASKKGLEEFETLKLSLNLRNTKQIVHETRLLVRLSFFSHPIALVKPPINFPEGFQPILHKDSIEECLKTALELTSSGVLIIVDDRNISEKLAVYGKIYSQKINQFTTSENPHEYLSQGNVLITDNITVSGYEWPTVIISFQHGNNLDLFIVNRGSWTKSNCATDRVKSMLCYPKSRSIPGSMCNG